MLSRGRREIFNTNQGSQFTSREYTGRFEGAGVAVSRDGRGRALDNYRPFGLSSTWGPDSIGSGRFAGLIAD